MAATRRRAKLLAMNASDSLRDDVDERLLGLFSEDPSLQRTIVSELIERAPTEPDLEEALVEALEMSLEHWNDDTQATLWIVVILGEISLERAVPVIYQALSTEDELYVAAAVRAFRRIGDAAFNMLLENLDAEKMTEDTFSSAMRVLEGVRLHDVPGTREVIEQQLITFISQPKKGRRGELCSEAAALTLAHIGCPQARDAIEHLHNVVYRRSNSFLQEALDLIDDLPDGVPSEAELPWHEEFRWALEGDPGGELSAFFEDE